MPFPFEPSWDTTENSLGTIRTYTSVKGEQLAGVNALLATSWWHLLELPRLHKQRGNQIFRMQERNGDWYHEALLKHPDHPDTTAADFPDPADYLTPREPLAYSLVLHRSEEDINTLAGVAFYDPDLHHRRYLPAAEFNQHVKHWVDLTKRLELDHEQRAAKADLDYLEGVLALEPEQRLTRASMLAAYNFPTHMPFDFIIQAAIIHATFPDTQTFLNQVIADAAQPLTAIPTEVLTALYGLPNPLSSRFQLA